MPTTTNRRRRRSFWWIGAVRYGQPLGRDQATCGRRYRRADQCRRRWRVPTTSYGGERHRQSPPSSVDPIQKKTVSEIIKEDQQSSGKTLSRVEAKNLVHPPLPLSPTKDPVYCFTIQPEKKMNKYSETRRKKKNEEHGDRFAVGTQKRIIDAGKKWRKQKKIDPSSILELGHTHKKRNNWRIHRAPLRNNGKPAQGKGVMGGNEWTIEQGVFFCNHFFHMFHIQSVQSINQRQR